MNPEEILKKPYARTFLRDEETGWYTALILEFPGCIAQGKDFEEAWNNLMSTAETWLTLSLQQGLKIPDPFEADPMSRRAVMRLIPLWEAVERWRDKHQIQGAESLRDQDTVTEDLPSFAKALLKIVGYLKHD